MLMTEQRKSPRYDMRLPMEVVRRGRQRLGQTGETCNLSAHGVLFTSEAPIAVGDPIEYHITLMDMPGNVRLRCRGRVVRKSDENEIAVSLERHEFVRAADARN